MKNRLILIIALLSSIILASGCKPINYDFVLGSVDASDRLPQRCSKVNIGYSYVFAQTKFHPGEAYKSFRYRAFIDANEYSYAENHPYDEDSTFFSVVVPENDTYKQRNVSIEISVSDSYREDEWGEWKEVYSGEQSCLESWQLPRSLIIGNSMVGIDVDGIVLKVDMKENEITRALKTFLSKGDVILEANFSVKDLITSSSALINNVPLNHVHVTRVSKGDIYMSDWGSLYIVAKNCKADYVPRMTYLGSISDDSIDNFESIWKNTDYTDHNFKITLKLVKNSLR